jgi:nucleotide-binding universal stress UspA family protein
MRSVPVVVHPQFKNILFTTDLSECSAAAAPFARTIARWCGSTVHILHVCDADAPGELIPSIEVEDQAALQRKMKTLADAFEGVTHSALIRPGAVSDVVSESIRELGIDLVIVGTHGEHGLKQFILGSTAEEILRSASCPVLSVGPEARKREVAAPSEILYATDFSTASEQAFTFALNLAHASGAKLTLLHAIDSHDVVEGELQKATAQAALRLSDLVQDHSDVRTQIAVEQGAAAEVILRKAKEIAADFVIMGAHGGTVAAHLPWKVVRQVVCHAECPVLTYRISEKC